MSGLRAKITLGYYSLAVVVGVFALVIYFDQRYLETRIQEGAVVSAFREDVLEMRRHEKNFLLYGDAGAPQVALGFAVNAENRLAANPVAFGLLAKAEELRAIRVALQRYIGLMRELDSAQVTSLVATQTTRNHEKQSADLRATGHDLSNWESQLGVRERALLAQTIKQSHWALMVSLGVLALLGLLVGHLLSRAVVKPLRRLEDELKPIAEGQFAHFSQVSTDREIVSLTDALNRMLDELEQRRRLVLQSEKLASIGVLASGVAHELNNPLGNISASCQILLEELESAGPEAQREWLQQIDDETERARRIVRTLLDYARRDVFQPRHHQLADVLGKSLLLLRRLLPGRDCVALELPPELGVCGDEAQLQQVFINLIKNALDSAENDVRIVVSAAKMARQAWRPSEHAVLAGDVAGIMALDEAAGMVEIALTDTGQGIPESILGRIFDPFFTTREPGHGVGLGLYVVEEIVREHGGCIAAENTASGGARFTIWLPCSPCRPLRA